MGKYLSQFQTVRKSFEDKVFDIRTHLYNALEDAYMKEHEDEEEVDISDLESDYFANFDDAEYNASAELDKMAREIETMEGDL